jgi:hypothetical protein
VDTSFGASGVVSAGLPGWDRIECRSVSADGGKIYVSGRCQKLDGQTPLSTVLACYDAQGNLDTSFGAGGLAVPVFDVQESQGMGHVVQPDGAILVAANYIYSGNPLVGGSVVYRLLPNGDPDLSFGTGGRSAVAPMLYNATGLALGAGTFYLCGAWYDETQPPERLGVARFWR